MENKVEKALGNFIDEPQVEEIDNIKRKKVVLDERDGLIIERLDPLFVTSDGRQLLREVY